MSTARSSTPRTADSRLTGTKAVERIGGTNRYDTAALVADYAANRGMSFSRLGFATGANFPDALSAGAAQGHLGVPVLPQRVRDEAEWHARSIPYIAP